jgi:hypothetical protein
VDFVLHSAEQVIAIEVKFAQQNIPSGINFEPLYKVFGAKLRCVVVTVGGQEGRYTKTPPHHPCPVDVWPVALLAEKLRTCFGR